MQVIDASMPRHAIHFCVYHTKFVSAISGVGKIRGMAAITHLVTRKSSWCGGDSSFNSGEVQNIPPSFVKDIMII